MMLTPKKISLEKSFYVLSNILLNSLIKGGREKIIVTVTRTILVSWDKCQWLNQVTIDRHKMSGLHYTRMTSNKMEYLFMR